MVTINYRGQQITVDEKQAAVLAARAERQQAQTPAQVLNQHTKDVVGDAVITTKSVVRTIALSSAISAVYTTEKASKGLIAVASKTNDWSVRLAEAILNRRK